MVTTRPRHGSSRLARALILGALIVTVTGPAQAEDAPEPTSNHRVFYQNLTVVRVNPLGLQNQFQIDWRYQLYDPGDSKLLANNYIGLSAAPFLTPAGTRLGIAFKFRPLNIFKIEVKWEFLNFWGNFDLLPSFASPYADFSDTAIGDAGDAELNYSTEGSQLTIDAELRAKIGPVIIRNRFKAARVDMSLERGDPVWYDQYYDLLLPAEGWMFLNDADVLVQVTKEIILGVRYSFGIVEYPDSAFLAGESRDVDNSNHRLGPLAAYTFFDEPGAAFNKPTVLLILNWYLNHRWRTGQDVSQAVPYVVLGFAFNGDLL